MSRIIRIRGPTRYYEPMEAPDEKYRLTWVTDEMKFAGMGLRRATNCRLALLKQADDGKTYRELVSVAVPWSVARLIDRYTGSKKTNKEEA